MEALEKREEPALTVTVPETRTSSTEEDRSMAVSKLLAKAYEKASELQLTPEETKGLRALFGDECVRSGAAGKSNLLYICHIHVSNRLNDVLGIGQWALVKRAMKAEEGKTYEGKRVVTVYFEGVMLIRGVFVTEAIGVADYHPNNPKEDYGTALESAMSDCLTRCCKRLGIGSQVWDKTYCDNWLKTHEAIEDVESKEKQAEAAERLKTLHTAGKVKMKSAYTGKEMKPGDDPLPPEKETEKPAATPEDTTLVAPVLAKLMKKDGITPAQLKAWYIGGNPKKKAFFNESMNPADLPQDFIDIIVSDAKWPRISREILENK